MLLNVFREVSSSVRVRCSSEPNTYADTAVIDGGNLLTREHGETKVLLQERESVRFRERKYNHEFKGCGMHYYYYYYYYYY